MDQRLLCVIGWVTYPVYDAARTSDHRHTNLNSARHVIIVSGVFIYAASNAYLSGGIGTATRELGLTEVQAGIILSLGAIAVVPTAPFWGYVSERIGRRVLILISIPLVLVGPFTMALVFSKTLTLSVAGAFWVLSIARAIKGIFGGALIPSTQAYMADITSNGARVSGMGLMGASVGFGALAGSALLWLTADHGIVFGFVLLLTAGCAVFAASLVSIPEAKESGIEKPTGPFPLVRVWRYFIITLSGFAAYTMVVPIVGLKFLDDHQLTSVHATKSAGIVLTCAALALAGAQTWVASRQGWDARRLLRLGSLGALFGLFLMVVAENVTVMAAGMALVGASLGAVAPGTLGAMSLSAGAAAQGKVAGINTAFRGIGIAAGPLFGTLLFGLGSDVPLYGAAALVGIIAALSWTAAKVQ